MWYSIRKAWKQMRCAHEWRVQKWHRLGQNDEDTFLKNGGYIEVHNTCVKCGAHGSYCAKMGSDVVENMLKRFSDQYHF